MLVDYFTPAFDTRAFLEIELPKGSLFWFCPLSCHPYQPAQDKRSETFLNAITEPSSQELGFVPEKAGARNAFV
jgi:hypothetical protein